MMKGLGTDIVEIARIERAHKRYGKAFLRKVFTQNEEDYCLKKKNPYPSLAARFCAKEAVAKALGYGFGEEISFKDIEVLRDNFGKPSIALSLKLKNRFYNPQLFVSISHSRLYATATVIWMLHDQIKT